MKFEETTNSEEYLYKGRIINLRRDTVTLPNGHVSQREVVEHPGGVCVVPLTGDGEVMLVRQFRYPYREEILEVPAGKLSPGEKPLECGIRELREETGASAERYTDLGRLYPSPGYSAEIIYTYLAQGLSYGEQQPDEDEFLDVVKMPLKEAVDRIMSGEITDAKTQSAILKIWYMRLENRV